MNGKVYCKHCGGEIRRYGGGDDWGHVNGVEFNLVTYCRLTRAEPADRTNGGEDRG